MLMIVVNALVLKKLLLEDHMVLSTEKCGLDLILELFCKRLVAIIYIFVSVGLLSLKFFNVAEKEQKVNKDNTIYSRFEIITMWAFFSNTRVTGCIWWLENIFKQQKEGWDLWNGKKASFNPASFTQMSILCVWA